MPGRTSAVTARKSNSRSRRTTATSRDAQAVRGRELPLPVVEELRRLGQDVLTMGEDGKDDQALPDDDVLAFAVEHQRALITMNRRDFIRLHRERPDHCGVVVCTFDPDFPSQARRIVEALASAPTLTRQLIRVYRTVK